MTQALLQAGIVSIDEVEGALVVGFAERQHGGSRYLMMQRSLDLDDDDGVYLENSDPSYGAFGRVSRCVLSPDRVELTIDPETADSLGTDATIAVEITCDEALFRRLRAAVERVLAGTDCQLQVTKTAS